LNLAEIELGVVSQRLKVCKKDVRRNAAVNKRFSGWFLRAEVFQCVLGAAAKLAR
jgi:hypothetical protein